MSLLKGKQIANATITNAKLVDDTIQSDKIDETGSLSTVNAGDAAVTGSATGIARKDHQHAVATAAPSQNLDLASTNAEGSASDLARSDHSHAFDVAAVGDIASVNSTKAAGTSNKFARADHVHDIANGAVDGNALATSALDAVLNSKYKAAWLQVNTFSANGGSDDVTTAVEGAATVDTERNDPTVGTGILTTGTTTGDTAGTAVQNYKVQIVQSSNGDYVDDGNGAEVYGVLSKSGAVWTMTYYKRDGTAYTFGSATNIDFLFAEVFTLKTLPETSDLTDAVFGDILNTVDHNHDDRYYTETELGATADPTGGSLIGVENADYSNFGSSPNATINNVEDALQNLNALISTGVNPAAHASDHISGGTDEIDGDQLDIDWNPTNYTPTTSPTEATSLDHLTAHLAGIDAAINATTDTENGEEFTGAGIATSGVDKIVATLTNTPKSAAGVKIYINGQLVRQGTTLDYSVNVGTKEITWESSADFDLESDDILTACYVS